MQVLKQKKRWLVLVLILILFSPSSNAQNWINHPYKDKIADWGANSYLGSRFVFDYFDNLYVMSTEGIVKYDGETWSIAHPFDQGHYILIDKENDFWIIGDYFSAHSTPLPIGLTKIHGTEIKHFNTSNSGFKSGYWITDMVFDRDNIGWFVGDRAELVKYNGASWKNILFEGLAFGSAGASCVALDTKNNLWIGTTSRGVFKYNESSGWQHYTTADGIVTNFINDIEADRHGNVWLATNQGLAKFDGNEWINFSTNDGLNANYIQSLKVDTKNHVWLVTYQFPSPSLYRLYKYDGETFTHYEVAGTDEDDRLGATLAIDANDNIWVKTTKTIAMLEADSPPIPLPTDIATTTKHPVSLYPNPAANSLLVDCPEFRKIEIFTLLGQRVLVSDQNELDIAHVEAGQYIVRTITDTEILHTSLVISR